MHFPVLVLHTLDGPTYIRADHISRCKSMGDGTVKIYTLDGRVTEYSRQEAREVLGWLSAEADLRYLPQE